MTVKETNTFQKVLARSYNTGGNTYDYSYMAADFVVESEFMSIAREAFDDGLFTFLAGELSDEDMNTQMALDRLDTAIAQLEEVRTQIAGLPECLGNEIPDEEDGGHSFNRNGVCLACGEKDKRG